jgi:hypothetical protein
MTQCSPERDDSANKAIVTVPAAIYLAFRVDCYRRMPNYASLSFGGVA